MKTCSRCGVSKPLDDFAKSTVKKDGRTYSCKVCLELGRKERIAANPEKAQLMRERDAARKRAKADQIYQKIKQRKEADEEYANRLKLYAQKYAAKNRDKELARGREYRLSITQFAGTREEYNEYQRQWLAKNKDRINASRRERLKNDPAYAEKLRQRGRDRYANSPHHRRTIALKTIYGITLDDYTKMYDAQQGCCAICGEHKMNGGQNGLVVDHCHQHGHVRKLLCPQCNRGLGHFHDSIEVMEKAIQYLKLDKERG